MNTFTKLIERRLENAHTKNLEILYTHKLIANPLREMCELVHWDWAEQVIEYK